MVPGSLIEDASFVVKNFIILRSKKKQKGGTIGDIELDSFQKTFQK